MTAMSELNPSGTFASCGTTRKRSPFEMQISRRPPSNYDKMTVDGVDYAPINDGGNSTFEIPVTLDEDIAVSAETVAMSTPHTIDYTLHFDSSTMKEKSGDDASGVVEVGRGA